MISALTPSYADHDSWLAQDNELECPIYLVVHSPGADPREHRWGVAWPVGSGSVAKRMTTAWKHIQLETAYDSLASDFDTPYTYLGAITKTPGPEMIYAQRYELGTTTLAARQMIDRLAHEIPVPLENEDWSCQDWVRELMQRMVELGMMSREVCDHAVAWAVSRA